MSCVLRGAATEGVSSCPVARRQRTIATRLGTGTASQILVFCFAISGPVLSQIVERSSPVSAAICLFLIRTSII